MVGLVRSVQLLATLIVAVPVAAMGTFTMYAGDLGLGAVFVGLAVAIVVLSEYVYGRLVGGTVGRLRR